MTLFTQEWEKGRPVIMLHPLALESTAFRSVARLLAGRDVHTIAVDLSGFGRTPGPDAPLTPACMADPVIELARSLATPPVVVGMSMGGRVALKTVERVASRFGVTADDSMLAAIQNPERCCRAERSG